MKRMIINSLFLGSLALIISCEPALKLSSDYDKTVDFSKYKTYSIYQLTDKSGSVSELNQNRLIAAVKRAMGEKGYIEAGTNPDVLVNITTYFKDKQTVTANTNYYGYGGYYRPYSWGGGMGGTTTYSTYDYKDGSIIIDVVDGAKQQLVWTGAGNKEIDKPAKDPEKAIGEAVTKIMAAYPPGVATKK